jgi:hypothetical protein
MRSRQPTREPDAKRQESTVDGPSGGGSTRRETTELGSVGRTDLRRSQPTFQSTESSAARVPWHVSVEGPPSKICRPARSVPSTGCLEMNRATVGGLRRLRHAAAPPVAPARRPPPCTATATATAQAHSDGCPTSEHRLHTSCIYGRQTVRAEAIRSRSGSIALAEDSLFRGGGRCVRIFFSVPDRSCKPKNPACLLFSLTKLVPEFLCAERHRLVVPALLRVPT